VQGWRFHFYSNEGNELVHIHAVKGGAECKYWLHPDRFDIVEDIECNCTPRLRRGVRQMIFQHFDQIIAAWREHFGGIVESKTKAVLAKAIETTPEALIVIMEKRISGDPLGKVLRSTSARISDRKKPR
jgi:hypothetical protein